MMPMMSSAPMNGDRSGLYLPAPAMPTFSNYTNTEIIEMVDQHEQDMQELVKRMDADFSRYRLTTHVLKDNATGDPLSNYAVYTSNAARVFADKVISWQVLAELLIRAPHLEVGRHEEEQDNLKERFAIGNLRAADERLKRMLQPSLRGQQSFYATVRGGYIGGRCLLAKNPRTGQTYADITVFDPMHTHWCLGADGLEWVCYKIKKTRAQIQREYGITIPGTTMSNSGGYARGSSDVEREGVYVYDFYDGRINTVIMDNETLKEMTPHGSPRVPCYLTLVGPAPLLQSRVANDLAKEVGESIYAGARGVYDKFSDVASIFLEIIERARRQTTIMESQDGKKVLEEDPYVVPTTIATRPGEKVYTLELQKMAQETMAYVTMIMGEMQRATLPFSAYGETPFQLSGFAITQLRQATETVLASRIEAGEQMNLQIVNLLYDQFMTGAFDGMKLSGMDSHRNYFSQTITPEMMEGTCDYTVKLVSQLPQDDMSKWATAEIAKKLELMDDEGILSNIVGAQDAQQIMKKVLAQKSARGLPEAQLYTMMLAEASQVVSPDDEHAQLAKMYLGELNRLMAVKLGIMPPAPKDGGGNGQSAQAKGGGQRPEVLPDAATGAAPQPETSNDGPSYNAPGTPRPGARGQP